MPSSPRSLLLALAFAISSALLCGSAVAQQTQDTASGLPDIGSSAGELLSPAEEAQYGQYTLRQLRGYELLLEDPLIEAYLQDLGYRLVARSEKPELDFTFFLLRSREINAFATLGGYVGFNAGLFLTAQHEDEIAAVLAHEISHVTQRHVLRGVERAQKDTLPIALAMLGAVLASQSAGGDGDATQAVLAGGLGLMQQRQINYTRSNEHEADRLGIQTLARAGYNPLAMADVFSRMERATRGNQGGFQAPEYLRTHPVTTTRISEAKDRAKLIVANTPAETASNPIARPINPLLPSAMLSALASPPKQDEERFFWARERLRVLSGSSYIDVVVEYEREQKATPAAFGDAQRYGLALARSGAGQTDRAEAELLELATRHPRQTWLSLALAENAHRAGNQALAESRYQTLMRDLPRNRAVILSYAGALAEHGTAEAGRTSQEVLRPLLASSGGDATFQRGFARASELAGDLPRAGEAYAEHAYLSGRPEDALKQLERLKQRDDLDYYQRARIDARIAAITPTVLELRERGVRPGERGDRQLEQTRPSLQFSVTPREDDSRR